MHDVMSGSISHTTALIDAALTLTSRLDVDATCEAMLDVVGRIFEARSSWVLLHEPRSNRLVTAAFRGPAGETFARISLPCDSGILGLAFSTGTPVFVPDVATEDRWFDADRIHDSGLPSVFTAPLLYHDTRIGALGFYSPRYGPDALPSAGDRALLQGLGALASLGILNARLFAQIADERRRRIVATRRQRKLREQVGRLRHEVRREADRTIIGRSAAIHRVLEEVRTVAGVDTTVLLLGETGTGKELVARAIHEASRRSRQPFIAVNCAAMPATLLESELFGHEKGAFTGAVERRAGRLEQADGGTLFLDEIGDLAHEAQAKLLRALQDGEVRRLGATKPIGVNVRVIAATNRNLVERVECGAFRPDLYFRLSVFPIQLPPLRDRRNDIPLLVDHFLDHFAERQHTSRPSISAEVMRTLEAYEWPGNVRELQNVVERGVILAKGKEIRREMLPGSMRRRARRTLEPPTSAATDERRLPSLDEIQRRGILRALETTGWRISGAGGAAAMLGLKPTTLHAKMKKLGLKRPAVRSTH